MAARPLLAACLAALAVLAGAAGAAGTVTVGVDAPASVDDGATTAATLVASGVDDPDGLGAFAANVTFDPAVVSVTASAAAGSPFTVTTATPAPGVLRVVGYVDVHPGPTGNVTLADLSVTGESAGDAAVDVTVETLADADGSPLANATTAASLTVAGTGGGGAGGTGGGGGGGGGVGPPSASSSVTPVGDGLRVSVEGARDGSAVSVVLPDTAASADTGVRFRNLELAVAADGDLGFTVTPLADRPDDAPDPGVPAVAYLRVDHDLPGGTLRSATFTFTVSEAALADRGLAPGDVVLYRYADGEWTALSTRLLGEAGSGYRYRANSPGFSVFAVGQRRGDPAFAVTDAALSTGQASPSETVSVTATVENTGLADGTATLELLVDGTVVDAQSVTVPAGETREVAFETAVGSAGEYELRVNDRLAGTLRVVASDEDRQEPTTAAPTTRAEVTDPATPDDEGDRGGLGGVGLLLVALAVLVAAVAFYAWQRD